MNLFLQRLDQLHSAQQLPDLSIYLQYSLALLQLELIHWSAYERSYHEFYQSLILALIDKNHPPSPSLQFERDRLLSLASFYRKIHSLQ